MHHDDRYSPRTNVSLKRAVQVESPLHGLAPGLQPGNPDWLSNPRDLASPGPGNSVTYALHWDQDLHRFSNASPRVH
jgi:hypothetical protein